MADPTVNSLLMGYIIGMAAEALILVVALRYDRSFVLVVRPRLIWWSLRRFKRFILVTSPSSLVESISNAGLPMLFTIAFGESAAGAIAMAQRLVIVPVAAVDNAVGEVFRARMAAMMDQPVESRQLFIRIVALLACVALVPCGVLYLFGTGLITLFLGSHWELAGQFVEKLVPVYFLSFVVGSISYVLFLHEKLLTDFAIQIVVSTLVTTVLLGASVLSLTMSDVFTVFVGVLSAKYLAQFIIIERLLASKVRT